MPTERSAHLEGKRFWEDEGPSAAQSKNVLATLMVNPWKLPNGGAPCLTGLGLHALAQSDCRSLQALVWTW